MTNKVMRELLKRGLSFSEAAMATEAVYSCAIEGAKIPETDKDFDNLVAMLKSNDTGEKV